MPNNVRVHSCGSIFLFRFLLKSSVFNYIPLPSTSRVHMCRTILHDMHCVMVNATRHACDVIYVVLIVSKFIMCMR